MIRWQKDPVVWLMLVSAVLLLSISIYSVRASYQRAWDLMHRESALIFRTAVISLEDSLRTIAFEDLGISRPGRPGSLQDTSQVTRIVIARDSVQNHRRSLRRRGRGSADKMRGSLALQLKLIKEGSASDAVFQDTSPEPQVRSMIERKASELLQSEASPYSLSFRDSTQLSADDTPRLAQSYHDVITNQHIFAVLSGYRPHLIRKVLPAILLSVFMIGATLLAFTLMYRNMRKQARLGQMKNDLIANITHELNTPISTVKVALEALQNFSADEHASGKAEEYLAISQLELTRLSFLVDSVLKNSMAEQHTFQLDQVVDLKAIVNTALESMSLQFKNREADVRLEANAEEYLVAGNQIQLSGVIYNLLDNALKYSAEKPIVHIKLAAEDEQILLTINDHGIGIPKEYQQKIFDRFFRVPQGNTHNVKGYGLGLTHVRQVIEKHRGKISVNSTTTTGTEFLIKLPSV